MSLPVVYQPAAQADIEEAFAWYEAQATGLGAEFVRRIKLVEVSIGREPSLYAVACHFDAADKPKRIRLHFVRDEVLAS